MKSSTVIFSCVFVIAFATLPYISNANPLLTSEGNALPNTQHFNSPTSEGGQFQFAQYGPYQQQQQQRLQKKWSRLEPSIRFFKRSEQQQQPQLQTNNNNFNSEFANRFMLY
uniref:Uncharacterized protein n=1 Tax=Panagrolaimus sp. PS1159 TaxID=55785 RepID=A0AC35F6F6_9BILA